MMSPNEKNKVKIRQICFVFLAFLPVTKISLLPSVIASFCEEQLYLACLLNCLLDLGVLAIILFIVKKHDNNTLFEIIKTNFSNTLAQIVYFFYGMYFLIKAILPIFEQQDYIHNTLYEISPSTIIFMPFFILSFYASLKGLKILGRCADLSIWFTLLGLFLVFLLSVPQGDFTNLLPIIQKPTYKPINASFKTLIWYSDSIYMLFFMGHFKQEGKQNKKVLLSFLGASLVTVFFMIVFYATFSHIAKTRFLAVPELTIYSLSLANTARFDYIAIFLLMFSQVFAIILPIYFATKCFERAFGFKSSFIPAIIVNLSLAVLTYIFSGKLFLVLKIITDYFSIFFIIVGYIVPLLLLFLPRRSYEVQT